jgi:hypothetical protein
MHSQIAEKSNMAAESDGPTPQTLPMRPVDVDHAIHDAPVIHVDGALGLAYNDQVVKLNLYQDRLVGLGDRPIQRVICARLVMSPFVFHQLLQWMQNNAPKTAPRS